MTFLYRFRNLQESYGKDSELAIICRRFKNILRFELLFLYIEKHETINISLDLFCFLSLFVSLMSLWLDSFFMFLSYWL